MAIRSIFEYVKDKCYNGLYDAAVTYFDENWHELDLNCSRVPDIESASVEDATVSNLIASVL